MQITLGIDDNILDGATHPAEQESCVRNGIPLLPLTKDAVPVTLELINRLHDDAPGMDGN